MNTCVIVGAIVSCLIDPATRPTPAQAAAILEQAPGISNRSNLYLLSAGEQRRVVFVPATKSTPPKTIEPRRLDGSKMSEPPAVYGIPYPHSVLSWAIANCCVIREGRTK